MLVVVPVVVNGVVVPVVVNGVVVVCPVVLVVVVPVVVNGVVVPVVVNGVVEVVPVVVPVVDLNRANAGMRKISRPKSMMSVREDRRWRR